MATAATTLPLEIEIVVNGKDVKPQFSGDMFVGQTVHYSSSAGDFELTFSPDNPGGATPFSKGGETVVVSGNKTNGSKLLVLQNEGTFTCRCSLTLSASGEKLGWPAAGDQSGGNHVVRRT